MRRFSTNVATRLEQKLVSGGDDRSALVNFRNKYNVSPRPLPSDALFRGSCTCNPPTQRGYLAAQALFDRFEGGYSYKDAMEDIRERIKKAFELEDTSVLLCPSGSDAEYIPVAIAQALSTKKIGNVVTQHKEIGAGSAPAANLEYFSKSTPMGSDPVEIGGKLDSLDVFSETVPARTADGVPVKSIDHVKKFVDQFEGLSIAHSVYGGKTGLRDDVMATGEDVIGVVDACQGRFTNAELRKWLVEDQCIVLITGSKFYRGPPFSGAVLVPNSLLKENSPPLLKSLKEFLCPDDLPASLQSWRDSLPQQENPGLALRWEAALSDIEASSPYSIETAERWAGQVSTMLPKDTIECFESNRCILSLRLRSSPDSPWFDVPDLKHIYDWMTLDVSDVVPEPAAAKTLCSIGQPVQVTQSSGILRLALGVDSLDTYTKNPQEALATDKLLIEKLHHLAVNFTKLKENAHLLKKP